MLAAVPDAELIGTGSLLGYILEFKGHSRHHTGHGVCTIEVNRGLVPGVLWKVHDHRALDTKEGVPTAYTIHFLDAKTPKGMVRCWTYRHLPAEYNIPDMGYYRSVLEGCNEHGLTQSCVREALQRVLFQVGRRTLGNRRP